MAVQGMGSPAAVRGSPGSTAEHCGAGAVCGGAPSQDGGVGPLRPGGEPLGCTVTLAEDHLAAHIAQTLVHQTLVHPGQIAGGRVVEV